MSAIPTGWIRQPDGSYSKPVAGKTTVHWGTEHGKTFKLEAAVEISKPKKRIRQDSKPLMNKLEARYHRILCDLYGENRVYSQAFRIKLGNGIWYKPDFTVFYPWTYDVITKPIRCIEVKGPHAFRGGFENLKVAASLYPHIQFILAWEEDGVWKDQLILS